MYHVVYVNSYFVFLCFSMCCFSLTGFLCKPEPEVLVYHLNKIRFYLFNAISSFGNLLTNVSSLDHLKFK